MMIESEREQPSAHPCHVVMGILGYVKSQLLETLRVACFSVGVRSN